MMRAGDTAIRPDCPCSKHTIWGSLIGKLTLGRARRGLACRARLCQLRGDTVGQPPSTEIDVPNMPSLKAKKLSKLRHCQVVREDMGTRQQQALFGCHFRRPDA